MRSLRYCSKARVPLFKIAGLGFLKRFPSSCKDLVKKCMHYIMVICACKTPINRAVCRQCDEEIAWSDHAFTPIPEQISKTPFLCTALFLFPLVGCQNSYTVCSVACHNKCNPNYFTFMKLCLDCQSLTRG